MPGETAEGREGARKLEELEESLEFGEKDRVQLVHDLDLDEQDSLVENVRIHCLQEFSINVEGTDHAVYGHWEDAMEHLLGAQLQATSRSLVPKLMESGLFSDETHARTYARQTIIGWNTTINPEGASGAFGHALTDFDPTTRTFSDSGDSIHGEQEMDRARALVLAQYDATQELLTKHGIRQLTLHRGIGWNGQTSQPDWAEGQFPEPEFSDFGEDYICREKQLDLEPHRQQPYASYSTDEDVAVQFAAMGGETIHGNRYEFGAVCTTTVPASAILSLPQTGIGHLGEREVIVHSSWEPRPHDVRFLRACE